LSNPATLDARVTPVTRVTRVIAGPATNGVATVDTEAEPNGWEWGRV